VQTLASSPTILIGEERTICGLRGKCIKNFGRESSGDHLGDKNVVRGMILLRTVVTSNTRS